MKAHVIGIAGKQGCGKSTFAKLLKDNYENSVLVDVDTLGHLSIKQESIKSKLVDRLGTEILDENGDINRKKLGARIFAPGAEEDKKFSDTLTWGFMKQELEKIIDSGASTVILDYALLPVTDLWDVCDAKILVSAPYELRKARVLRRDPISEEYFEMREKKSVDYTPYKFDHVVENIGEDGELELAVKKVCKCNIREEGECR